MVNNQCIRRAIGCLPFTQKIRKFRMECKWKINLVSLNGNFLGKTGYLERKTKIPKRKFRMKMCIPFSSFYWFQAFWLASPLILSSEEKSWKWNERIPVKISIRNLTRPIYHTYIHTFYFAFKFKN